MVTGRELIVLELSALEQLFDSLLAFLKGDGLLEIRLLLLVDVLDTDYLLYEPPELLVKIPRASEGRVYGLFEHLDLDHIY